MGTQTFWQHKKYQIIGASLGIVFHSLLLVVVMGGKGIIGVFLVMFDFPLAIPMYLFDIFSGIHIFGVDILFIVGGTLMYAVLGWKAHPFFARHPELLPHSSQAINMELNQPDDQDGSKGPSKKMVTIV